MDHADASDSDGQPPQEEIADGPPLRGNSTGPTPSMAEAEEGDAVVGAAVAPDEGLASMEVDSDDAEEGADGGSADDGPSSAAEEEEAPADTNDVDVSTTGEGLGDRDVPAEKQPASGADDTADSEADTDKSMNGGAPSPGPIGESATVDTEDGEAAAAEASGAQLSGPEESFDQAPDMSFDEVSNGDVSQNASSMDAEHSEADTPAKTPAGEDSARAPLESLYGPYIHPTDTSLADARERLQVAIEQTRLLRMSFADQAYERYLCIMKPVPESLEEIIEPIRSDPEQAGVKLREQMEVIKAEKHTEKKQAQKAGVGLEEVSYFGGGLHLVVLPEDEVDEEEIDIAQFPHRGPTDPKTGERTEDIAASAATTTDQVFDRIRRIRVFRMGGELAPPSIPDAPTQIGQMTRPSAFAAAPRGQSPAPSVDSDVSESNQMLQHLLTLAPDAEGGRADGGYTAVQSALMARGVGMNEAKRDFRINPLHQRMFQHNFFAPTPAYKLLPPLLAPHQLFRLQAANSRKEDPEVRADARESIKSVVEDICSGKYSQEEPVGSGGSGSKGTIGKALSEKRSALEIGLLHRMRTATVQNQKGQGSSDENGAAPEGEPGTASDAEGADTSDYDPVLALSVMNAVGLLRKEVTSPKRPSVLDKKAHNAYAQALGLEGLMGLEAVSNFFDPEGSSSSDGKKRPLPDSEGPTNEAKRPKLVSGKMEKNGDKEEDTVEHIRGGGGQDETEVIKPKAALPKETDAASPPSLAGFVGFNPLLPVPPVPVGGKGSQSAIAAAATQQLLQHQLGIHALAHQLPTPVGSVPSYLARPNALAQNSQAASPLRLLPGQMNAAVPEQEAARYAAAARAHATVTAAAAARYQAALPSANPHIPIGLVASMSQLRSNEMQTVSPTLAPSSNKLQRKRPSSLSKKSASSSPPSDELNSPAPNGGMIDRVVSHDEASLAEKNFTVPTPPEGLSQEMAVLIAGAKFHEAHSISAEKSEESEAHLIEFLLSLGAALPVPREFIASTLAKKLSSPNYLLRLHEFVGSSSAASTARDVIVAIISIWLWTEHKDTLKESIVDVGESEADSKYKWLINVAIDKCLLALVGLFDSRPVRKPDGTAKDAPKNEQVAAAVSQSLTQKVFIDSSADTSFPAVEDLLKLLDSLRKDALRAKTQERVLLAALASRCGTVTEAFSNSYVSSIVRAGVALGHETVCEMGQEEESKASTMLPYDFFHDDVGVWEEPCRPPAGFHSSVGGDILKKQAHARSVFQKSLKTLQNRHRLKGGVAEGGPYYPSSSSKNKKASSPSTASSVPPLVRTPSGSLKRRGSSGALAETDMFDPDFVVAPMVWNPDDVANTPYGLHDIVSRPSKKMKLSDDQASPAIPYRSSDEIEWEEVANLFVHGGSTGNIDISYDFDGASNLGKKKIIAPFVREIDWPNLELAEEEDESDSDEEDISDEAILERHQEVLREMKIKLDAVLEARKQNQQKQNQQKR
ncbi:hypothetical protein ACHAXT_004714 [Thalassiosira profunda]